MYESLLANVHDCSPQSAASELEVFEDRLLWRELRGGEGIWFPRHDLLSEAVLGIELGSTRLQGTALKEFTIAFVKRLSGRPESEDICRAIVWSLVGTDREQAMSDEMDIGPSGIPTLSSRLLRHIGSISGQDEVWRAVNDAFPNHPLFLAHYGRFLYSRDVRRYTESQTYLLKANHLAEERDHTILHMLGMRCRSELQTLLPLRRRSSDVAEVQAISERISTLGIRRQLILSKVNRCCSY